MYSTYIWMYSTIHMYVQYKASNRRQPRGAEAHNRQLHASTRCIECHFITATELYFLFNGHKCHVVRAAPNRGPADSSEGKQLRLAGRVRSRVVIFHVTMDR